tara:strand:- start:1347 stop:1562 length:216 start_codon:yes stop_codon:yes gene_type:complete
MERKCPRCKTIEKKEWTANGYTNSTYCRECQKYYNKRKRDKINEVINKVTRNGEVWWLHQSIMSTLNDRKK